MSQRPPDPDLLAWIDHALATAGRLRSGEPVLVQDRAWSTVWAVPIGPGVGVWFKVNGGATRYEAALLALLHEAGMGGVPRPLAVDAGRGWSLLADGGTRLRERRDAADLSLWPAVLRTYATAQRTMESAVPQLLAAGVPDHRAPSLPDALDRLLADDQAMRRGHAGEPTPEDVARLRALRPQIVDWCAELAASPVADTIQHDDLHSANVLLDAADRPTVIDWGDASVAHPFTTLLVTLSSIARHAGLAGLGDPVLHPLRDAYLAAWADVAEPARLLRDAELAVRTGHIGRALSWHRALLDASADELAEFGDAVPGWLLELLDE